MAHTQLQGQIFKHAGVNYLVLEDNDFTADTLRVKTVDSRRHVCEMAVQDVLQALLEEGAHRPADRAA